MHLLSLRHLALTSARRYHIRPVTSIAAVDKAEVPLKSWKDIPGPSSFPFIGVLHHFMPGGNFYNLDGLKINTKMYETYGPLIRLEGSFGKAPMILIGDAESASQILRGENVLPERISLETLDYYRKIWKKDAKNGRPTGLVTEQGELWKELRSQVNPVLLQPKVMRLYTSALDKIAMEMVTRIKSQRDENNMIRGKFNDEMNLWSLESVSVVALGCRLGCLDANQNDPYVKQLISCVRELFVLGQKLDFNPSVWRLISTPNFRRAMKLYELQETIAKNFIKQATKEFKTKSKSNDEKGVLEKLLDIDENIAHTIATDMLLAGVDSASNTMAATLYLLAANPDKQAKLREELRSSKDKRPYLKACMKESFRLMPVVAGNARVTTKEYNLLGYRIPSGTVIAVLHLIMGLMEEHFPRPNEFLPERWLVEKNDPLHYGRAHPFSFNVFGYGVRSCMGRRIAELEMELLTARMVENFQIEWFGPPPRVEQTLVNYVKGPFNFIFKDAPK